MREGVERVDGEALVSDECAVSSVGTSCSTANATLAPKTTTQNVVSLITAHT